MAKLNSIDKPSFMHIPVMAQEAIAGLAPQPGSWYLDATVGGGGHSHLLLDAAPDSHLIGIDRDDAALEAAQAVLTDFGDRVELWRGNFASYDPGSRQFDGILADLGVSSSQFDVPERGFSFRHEADLDMRMDRRQSLSAADIINHWEAKELADLFYHYGEERHSRRIARQIVAQRPFRTTTELAEAIARSQYRSSRSGKRSGKARSRSKSAIHPATRVFQALRIAVNEELTSLETLLEKAPTWLKPGGRLAIISFHSLEDRRVKHGFRDNPLLQVLTKKPIIPQPEECDRNPRARSAKLRLAERLA